jgi:LacI family transcriptional regulator
VPGRLSIEYGRIAMKKLLCLKERPDAVFAVEDFTALGAIKELKEQQIRIPGEVGVIGFANEIFSEHITPSISTVDQQTVKMGEEAFTLLLQLMSDNEKEKIKTKIVLEAIPIFRESSLRYSMKNQIKPALCKRLHG